jgi:hypothetical protein
MQVVSPAEQYFFEHPPSDFANRLQATARDLIVAKVRLGNFIYLVRRDQSGRRPPAPKFRYQVSVEVVEALEGPAEKGARFEVYFALSSEKGQRFIYPVTPSDRARDYFIISYLDSDNNRRLQGLPVGEQRYERWNEQFLNHLRERSRPGSTDR